MGKVISLWKKINKDIRFSLIHFCLSFLYERFIFIFKDDTSFPPNRVVNEIISDSAEKIFAYIAAKVVAFLLIFCFWKVVFTVINNRNKPIIRILSVFFIVASAISLIIYPYHMYSTPDNCMTYSYAIRLNLDYWHSAYSSIVYSGMLMVIPHSAFMTVLQMFYITSAIGYLYFRLEKTYRDSAKAKWFAFVILLIPEIYYLFINMYRTNQYTILAIFYFTLISADFLDKRKRTIAEMLFVVFLAAFMSVWRSEGIVIGFLTIMTVIISSYWKEKKKMALFIFAYLILFFVILIPQKIGDAKYYGNDYKFINSFPSLQNILNDKNSNLTYEGCEDDIAAIDAIVPHELVAIYGMDGYRRYNYANGRGDMNQSMASSAAGEAYQKAYYNLILHNIPIYAKTQITLVASGFGLIDSPYEAECTLIDAEEYPAWSSDAWVVGQQDVLNSKGAYSWSMNIFRQNCLRIYLVTEGFIAGLLKKICYLPIVSLAILFSDFALFITEAVRFFRKKRSLTIFGILSGTLLMQLMAIILVIPYQNYAYFYTIIYSSVVILLFYSFSFMEEKKKSRIGR